MRIVLPDMIETDLQRNTNTDIQALKYAEAVVRRYSVKKVFLKISQNLQENTSAIVSFLIKLQA